jgi:hypothetical protein
VRVVRDFPAESFVVRRADYAAAIAAGIDHAQLVRWLTARGRRAVYTPDASVAAPPAPVVRAHLRATFRHGVGRGIAARETLGRSLSLATALSLAPALAALVGAVFLGIGGALFVPGLVLVLVYAGALLASGLHAVLRFRSLAVGALEPPAVVTGQLAYLAGFVRGVTRA